MNTASRPRFPAHLPRQLARAAVLVAVLCAPPARCHAVNMLMVIQGASPDVYEGGRKSNFESWGHTVTTIQDSQSQAAFDTAIASADVVWVPATIQDWELLYKLRMATCGVITETFGLDTEFGFATSDGYTTSSTTIEQVNNSHPVTAGLASGTLAISGSNIPIALNGNAIASGMTKLATKSGGQLSLGVIEAGGTLANTYNGNSNAAGRRVRLPWGNITVNLNSNGVLIAQQAITWAAATAAASGGYDLLLVTAGAAPTSEESARKTQFESWGHTVTTIEDSDTDVNFAAAVAAADVVYVPQSADAASLAYKLRTAPIGVVHEGVNAWDDNVGWTTSTGQNTNTCTTMTVVDNKHAISEGFATGSVTIFNTSTNAYGSQVVATLASGAEVFATNLCVNAGNANLLALDLGAALANTYSGNNTASGRRVRLPYGGGNAFAWSNLSSGGLTMVKNAIKWAGQTPLTLRLKLEETSGATAADSSGNSHDGAYTGAPQLGVTAPRDLGARFSASGVTDMITLPNAALNGACRLTVGFWIRTTSTAEQTIVSGANSSQLNELKIAFLNSTTLEVALNNVEQSLSVDSIATDAWIHFAVVVGGNSTKIYRNGQLIGTLSSFGTGGTLSIQGLVIGQDQDSVLGGYQSTQRLIASLDDLNIYTTALSEAYIAELYGLIGHWQFDEGAGSTIADSSLKSNDASFYTGTPVWVDGVRGTALEFNGSNDTLTQSEFNPPSEGTVTLWFRSNGPPTARQRPWGLGGNFEMWQDADGLVSCDVSTDGYQGGFITTEPLYTAGRWYHLAAVYDSDDDSYTLYLDGQLHKTGISTWDISKQSPAQLAFGTRTGTVDRFSGALDDFRVYNRKLSHAEIAEIYGLVAYWKLDETSGTIAYDSSGMGNNATLTGTQGWTTEGQIDGGFNFNYNDGIEYFQAPSNKVLDNLQEDDYSVTAWVNLNSVPTGSDPTYDASYSIVRKYGYHTGLVCYSGGVFACEHWLASGPTWTGAGDWSTTYGAGAFYHVASVVNRTDGEIRIYVDGELKETGTFTPGAATWEYGSNPWRIGAAFSGITDWGHPMDGVIDDARLYNRALDDAEVLQIYQSGLPQGLRILQWVEMR